MDAELLQRLGHGNKQQRTESVVHHIDGDASRLRALVDLFLGPDHRMSHYASWPLTVIALQQPALIAPYHPQFISCLKDDGTAIGTRRNLARLYQWAEIPSDLEGELYDICIRRVQDLDETVAVRAFSASVALRIVQRYPDLSSELRSHLERQYANATSGLQNRYRKILSRLEQIAE